MISIADPSTLHQVRKLRESLTRDQPVFESKQTFHFTWEEAEPASLGTAPRRMLVLTRPNLS